MSFALGVGVGVLAGAATAFVTFFALAFFGAMSRTPAPKPKTAADWRNAVLSAEHAVSHATRVLEQTRRYAKQAGAA